MNAFEMELYLYISFTQYAHEYIFMYFAIFNEYDLHSAGRVWTYFVIHVEINTSVLNAIELDLE